MYTWFITLCACARGKVIDRVIVVVVVIIHKKLPDLGFRHLSDSKVQRICRNWRKTGLGMLRIELYGLQASNIPYLI